MHLIGITGGIAVGKSSVTNIVRQHGYTVLDGDLIARQVVAPGRPVLKKIHAVFGDEVLLPNGCLNRPVLGNIIFADKDKRRLLNSIVHPAIYQEILSKCLSCLLRREDLVFLDLPLLYESGEMVKFLTKVIVVYCQPDLQFKRLAERNPDLSVEEARNRISSQMNQEDKRRRAHFVVDNSTSMEDMKAQVDDIMDILERTLTPSWKYHVFDFILFALGSLTGYLVSLSFHK